MCLAAGVISTHKILMAIFVHFEIVCDRFTCHVVADDSPVGRVLKLEVFHLESLRFSLTEQQDGRAQIRGKSEEKSVDRRDVPQFPLLYLAGAARRFGFSFCLGATISPNPPIAIGS